MINSSYARLQSIASAEFRNLRNLGLTEIDWDQIDGKYNCIYAFLFGNPNSEEALRTILDCAPLLVDNTLGYSQGKLISTDIVEVFLASYGKTILHNDKSGVEIINTRARHEYFITPLEAITPYKGSPYETQQKEFLRSLING